MIGTYNINYTLQITILTLIKGETFTGGGSEAPTAPEPADAIFVEN